jgi:hypothetical protein
LLIFDGHESHVAPGVIERAAELGFDMLAFPGGITALLQLMDQLFAKLKHDYTIKETVAIANNRGVALSKPARVTIMSKVYQDWLTNGAAAHVKKALKKIGLWPPSYEQAVSNLKDRTALPRDVEDALAGADPATLSQTTQEIILPAKRKDSVALEIAQEAAAGSGGSATRPAQKGGKRQRLPRSWMNGDTWNALASGQQPQGGLRMTGGASGTRRTPSAGAEMAAGGAGSGGAPAAATAPQPPLGAVSAPPAAPAPLRLQSGPKKCLKCSAPLHYASKDVECQHCRARSASDAIFARNMAAFSAARGLQLPGADQENQAPPRGAAGGLSAACAPPVVTPVVRTALGALNTNA